MFHQHHRSSRWSSAVLCPTDKAVLAYRIVVALMMFYVCTQLWKRISPAAHQHHQQKPNAVAVMASSSSSAAAPSLFLPPRQFQSYMSLDEIEANIEKESRHHHHRQDCTTPLLGDNKNNNSKGKWLSDSNGRVSFIESCRRPSIHQLLTLGSEDEWTLQRRKQSVLFVGDPLMLRAVAEAFVRKLGLDWVRDAKENNNVISFSSSGNNSNNTLWDVYFVPTETYVSIPAKIRSLDVDFIVTTHATTYHLTHYDPAVYTQALRDDLESILTLHNAKAVLLLSPITIPSSNSAADAYTSSPVKRMFLKKCLSSKRQELFRNQLICTLRDKAYSNVHYVNVEPIAYGLPDDFFFDSIKTTRDASTPYPTPENPIIEYALKIILSHIHAFVDASFGGGSGGGGGKNNNIMNVSELVALLPTSAPPCDDGMKHGFMENRVAQQPLCVCALSDPSYFDCSSRKRMIKKLMDPKAGSVAIDVGLQD
eukprot:PhM_4_TR8818/c0_g1_i1/m.105127